MSVPKHLKIGIDGLDVESLLSDWRHLVPTGCTPIMMTALGDIFLRDSIGRIHFLDLMCGKFSQVASTHEEFDALCDDREQRRKWFAGFLVMELRKHYGEPPAGKCFSCKIPLSLGGRFETGNFEPTDIKIHFSILGQLHQQTMNLPEGTRINEVKFDGPV
jgi:hypothetical protein